MNQFCVKVLLLLSSLLGVNRLPKVDQSLWQISKSWHAESGYQVLEMRSSSLPTLCANHPSYYVNFPVIIHGIQEVYSNGSLVQRHGSFDHAISFYGSPIITCKQLVAGEVDWKVYSPSTYFARISYYPYITRDRPWTNIMGETVNVGGAVGLIILGIFTFVIFTGKVPDSVTLSSILVSISFSLFCLFSVPDTFGVSVSMPTAHKLSDFFVALGCAFLFYILKSFGALSSLVFYTNLVISSIGSVLLLSGQTVDEIQFGTTIFFSGAVLCLVYSTVKSTNMLIDRTNQSKIAMISLLLFTLSGLAGVASITGIYSGPMIFPFGIICGVLFVFFGVNQIIVDTYKERDYLRGNLEREVERKTNELKSAQAELVHSAKLASLGTLAAGIAHEINNSVNYVNGALAPLERIVRSNINDDGQKSKADKLFNVMKDGIKLTVEIINSLRNYTGLNQAKFNEVRLVEIINSSLTILRSKIDKRIEIVNEVDREFKIFGDIVALNQIFMNLISNAIDAMTTGGSLTFKARALGDKAEIMVQDTGTGIPAQNLSQIFDPFFTTKTVGAGTGLGLHIVMTEIKNHNGRVDVKSEVGKGTCFILTLPLSGSQASRGRAA